MSNLSHREATDLTDFFRLTISSELSPIEIAEALQYVSLAPTNPEYQYIIEHVTEPGMVKNLLRTNAVVDWLEDEGLVAKSDKLDEFHERICDLFEDELPPFSTWLDNSPNPTSPEYYAWLDELIAGLGDREHGGYELLSIDPGRDDNQYTIAIERNNTPKVLLLSRGLSLRIDRLKTPAQLWWWI
jgi:hypothetical protein